MDWLKDWLDDRIDDFKDWLTSRTRNDVMPALVGFFWFMVGIVLVLVVIGLLK